MLGWCVPWKTLFGHSTPVVRVVSLNLREHSVDEARLLRFLDSTDPDVVLFQEYLTKPLLDSLKQRGYEVRQHKYLVTGSRLPLTDYDVCDISAETLLLRTTILTKCGPVHVFNLHLPSPSNEILSIIEDITGQSQEEAVAPELSSAMRQRESSDARRWIDTFVGPRWVGGDFNQPQESSTYRRDWSDLNNAFGVAGFSFGWTRHVNSSDFARRIHLPQNRITTWPLFGARIDHLLTSEEWCPRSAWVGPDVGSDHRPLVVDLGGVR